MERVANSDVGPNLREMEAAELRELKDTYELRPAYKVCCAQWNRLLCEASLGFLRWKFEDCPNIPTREQMERNASAPYRIFDRICEW